MQITYKGDYALKAILFLAERYGETVVTIHELAKKLDIPVKFLEQILLDLKRGGFVDSRRGIKGGYQLVRPPKEIKLGDVVRFIDGPVEPIACSNISKRYKGCRDIYACVFKDIWVKVATATSNIVDNITFEELANRLKAKNFNYCI